MKESDSDIVVPIGRCHKDHTASCGSKRTENNKLGNLLHSLYLSRAEGGRHAASRTEHTHNSAKLETNSIEE